MGSQEQATSVTNRDRIATIAKARAAHGKVIDQLHATRPVLCKVLTRIDTYLQDAAECLASDAPASSTTYEASLHGIDVALDQLLALLNHASESAKTRRFLGRPRRPGIDHALDPGLEIAFQIKAELRRSIVGIWDDVHLLAALDHMHARAAAGAATPVREYDVIPSWTDLYPFDELSSARKSVQSAIRDVQPAPPEWAGERQVLILKLIELWKDYDRRGMLDRTESAQRAQYIAKLASRWSYGLLVVAAAALMLSAGGVPEASPLVLMMIYGALGSLLGLLYKFRDGYRSVLEMLDAWSLAWAQIFVGATAALIAYAILTSGVIQVLNTDQSNSPSSTYALVGFIVGYSEPVFLGLVSRVAGVVNPEEPK